MTPAPTPETCPHARIAPQLAAVTSVVALQVTMSGFKCEDCGKQWDMGDAASALARLEAAEANWRHMRRWASGNNVLSSEQWQGAVVRMCDEAGGGVIK